jgi:hypothetical protein
VKLGLFAINYGTCADPDTAIRVARHAEDAGFESLWSGEHLVLPDPAPAGFSLAPTLPLLDTVVGLTLVAAHTSTVKIASGIIVLPLRNPVVPAKELASLDRVAPGAGCWSASRIPGLFNDRARPSSSAWADARPSWARWRSR